MSPTPVSMSMYRDATSAARYRRPSHRRADVCKESAALGAMTMAGLLGLGCFGGLIVGSVGLGFTGNSSSWMSAVLLGSWPLMGLGAFLTYMLLKLLPTRETRIGGSELDRMLRAEAGSLSLMQIDRLSRRTPMAYGLLMVACVLLSPLTLHAILWGFTRRYDQYIALSLGVTWAAHGFVAYHAWTFVKKTYGLLDEQSPHIKAGMKGLGLAFSAAAVALPSAILFGIAVGFGAGAIAVAIVAFLMVLITGLGFLPLTYYLVGRSMTRHHRRLLLAREQLTQQP